MSFWANYVLLKEKKGITREVSLAAIETKFGIEDRQKIEAELNG